MSDCVRYPAPGCVVEYLEGNAVQIALITEEAGGRLRLLLPNRRETRLNASRLLPWLGPLHGADLGRDEAVRLLEQHKKCREELASDVPVMDVWELAQGEVSVAPATWFAELFTSDPSADQVSAYGRALLAMESNNFDQARKTLQPLLSADPQNPWYLDLATDIDLGQKKTGDAINRLKNARELRTNPVLQLNLANALLQGGQPGEAATILNRYTFTYKEDGNGWDLLAQAEGALGNRDQELAARAESMALVGQLEQAISLLSSASSQVKLGSLQQARYDARIDQLRELQARFRPYQKM